MRRALTIANGLAFVAALLVGIPAAFVHDGLAGVVWLPLLFILASAAGNNIDHLSHPDPKEHHHDRPDT